MIFEFLSYSTPSHNRAGHVTIVYRWIQDGHKYGHSIECEDDPAAIDFATRQMDIVFGQLVADIATGVANL